ncbi:3-oxoacyl-(acyl-carrier-protein) synthase [Vibrio sp. RC586]|uniref:beta-ketoacyl synthase chain length factor n=1 Tax=Vibrio sp. RC586 TaxID=675815 RepID=UPI0001BB7F7F|nr:beta-ketoacyl synthase chain length factor [Vibrio sp. RC586]EEY99481.1 3-oxoacyl-(acyl-carrier-protein) synthase [Vibrio sp. RC586]
MLNSSYPIKLNIENWYANSAGLNSQEAWKEWAVTDRYPDDLECSFHHIPAMMRRRMSEVSKHAVQTASELLNQTRVDYLVFSSRHGELHRSNILIKEILLGQEASPMAFSQTVHNTAAGLTTIATQKAIPLTSISAGENTFHSALIEAYGFLQQNPGAKVLLLDFDETLPEDYQQYEYQTYRAYALGLILTLSEEPIHWSTAAEPKNKNTQPQALQFLKQLLSDGETLVRK